MIQDETERTRAVVVNQRSYVVPADVAAEIESLEHIGMEEANRADSYKLRAESAERQRDEAKAELAARLMALQAANSAVADLQRERDEAIAATIERCAKVCERPCAGLPDPEWRRGWLAARDQFARAIRALLNQK